MYSKNQNCQILDKVLYISSNIESTKVQLYHEFLFVSGTVINSIEDTRLDKPTPTGRDGGRRDIAPERKV